MNAVRAQKEDVPHDSEDPLFDFGFGLSYENPAETMPPGTRDSGESTGPNLDKAS